MLKHRFFTSFLSTLLLYVVVGISFFYLSTETIAIAEKPQEKKLSFSLSEYTPEVLPPVEEPVKEEIVEPEPPEPEPVVEEKIEPIVEEVVPEPIVAKPLPKPIVKKVVKTKKKHVKKRVIKKRLHKKRTTKKATKQKASSTQKFSAAKKNAFLSQIRTRINKNKTYPRIAQRRGMQGTVKVRFTILANGQVNNISVRGPKVFQRSAKNAIKKAFPISTKNAPFSLPTTVNLTLRYQIK